MLEKGYHAECGIITLEMLRASLAKRRKELPEREYITWDELDMVLELIVLAVKRKKSE